MTYNVLRGLAERLYLCGQKMISSKYYLNVKNYENTRKGYKRNVKSVGGFQSNAGQCYRIRPQIYVVYAIYVGHMRAD